MKLIALALMFLACGFAHANLITVVNLSGKVSSIIPTQQEEEHVFKKKTYPTKTIFKTKEKSFVQIQYLGINTTIGPNSEVQITLPNSKKETHSMINLTKGKIRSWSKKNQGKLYIHSKSAAIGVRGTDFIVTYNPINRISSLLTLRGETEIQKRPDSEIFDDEDITLPEQEVLRNELDSYQKNFVKPGELSSSYPGEQLTTNAIKISNEQFNVLLKNTTLAKESSPSTTDASESIPHAPKLTEKEGVFEDNTDKILDGGYFDLNTGFYISPPNDSGVIPKEYGEIDQVTGEYIPPKGLILDPLKGFISVVGESIEKLKEIRNKLNRKLENEIFELKEKADLSAEIKSNYRYQNYSYERFFLVPNRITKTDIHQINIKGKLQHNTFSNKRYDWRPSLFGSLSYNSRRSNEEAKRNDEAFFGGSLQFKRKFLLFKKMANFSFTPRMKLSFRDLNNESDFDYYSRELNFRTSFNTYYSGLKQLKFKLNYTTFESYQSQQLGKLFSFSTEIDFFKTRQFELSSSISLGHRDYNQEQAVMNSTSIDLLLYNIARKTDLEMKFKTQNLFYDHSQTIKEWNSSLTIDRRKGPFLKYYIQLNFESISGFGRAINLDGLASEVGLKGFF
ncbi:FecR family protein [Halobacteriovorax sp. GB3]|uniref:FecR family protein n=1 Tax=Halobacteriovorax sp. GB3 TaxID=2719615 RepID=UPI00236037B9|nr:FecR family protein [Halobacteriovorax sp. GB3]MDD0852436.1 FecR family protein [Halobacteriovorax sp. GB3]